MRFFARRGIRIVMDGLSGYYYHTHLSFIAIRRRLRRSGILRVIN